MRMAQMAWDRWVRCLWGVAALLIASCSGSDLQGGAPSQKTPNADNAGAPDFVAGVNLAVVKLTPTNTIEFWEIEPGNVLMIQKWDEAHGEQRLDLARQFQQADYTLGGLYRKLMNDPSAALSAELVSADEHRRNQPIRDASLPRPASGTPPFPPKTHGPAQSASVPTTVAPLGVGYTGGGFAPLVGIDWCQDFMFDGYWCPPGTYGDFARGNALESIYLDTYARNPQATGASWDQYTLYRIWSSSKSLAFSYGLAPGHAVEVYYVGTAATFQGGITGTSVSYAEKWRLSFPSLSQVSTHPDWGMTGGSFGNDIEGISHADYIGPWGGGWFLSRTEFDHPYVFPYGDTTAISNHGQIGFVPWINDLQTTGPSVAFDEPFAWKQVVLAPTMKGGYLHYGDIVYVPPSYSPGYGRLSSGFVVVSINDAGNTRAGVGFLGVNVTQPPYPGYLAPLNWTPFTLEDWGTTELSASEQDPCVAVVTNYMPVEGWDHVHIYIPASFDWTGLHEYSINFTTTPPVKDCLAGYSPCTVQHDIPIRNGNWTSTVLSNPNGMKVSSHGKLWVWGVATESVTGRLYGIDPYTGMIQVQYDYPYNSSSGKYESEGLDIVESDPVSQIHLQSLQNNLSTTDPWTLTNLKADDISRL